MNIKVFIVEDDDFFVNQVKKFLRNTAEIDIIGSAKSKEDALDNIISLKPDVILMDIELGKAYDGIDLTKEILKKINTKVIMLTGMLTEEAILHSIEAGADKYILKTNLEELPISIRNLKNCCPDTLIAQKIRNDKTNLPLSQLNSHQQMYVKMLLEGKSRTQISQELVIELCTVKKNISRIYKKLKVKSRQELINTFDISYLKKLES